MVVLASIIGCLIGTIVTNIIHHVWFSQGTLKIDHANPEKDIYRLEIGDLDRLAKKRYVVVKIDNNADLSQN